MFLVKTKLNRSKIHGIGVFADQKIKKGAEVYVHDRKLDLILSDKEFLELDPREQAVVKHYGYIEKQSGKHRMDHDDIRFINHSTKPNISNDNPAGKILALRDIKKGEELSQSYAELG